MKISEQLLQKIKKAPKTMAVVSDKPAAQGKSNQWSFVVALAHTNAVDAELSGLKMRVFARQNRRDVKGFSCGFYVIQGSKKTTLSRYNGSDHPNDVAHYECHIHHATVKSINENHRVPEHADTKVTGRYTDLGGAVNCLCADYNISRHNFSQTDLWS